VASLDFICATADEARALLGEGATVSLSGGRTVTLPRVTIRKAIEVGPILARIVDAVCGEKSFAQSSASEMVSRALTSAIEPLTELAAAILDVPDAERDAFADSLAPSDLAAILIAFVEREMGADGWGDVRKKARALFAPQPPSTRSPVSTDGGSTT
jgi:hypothetical protein